MWNIYPAPHFCTSAHDHSAHVRLHTHSAPLGKRSYKKAITGLLRQRDPNLHTCPGISCWCTGRYIRRYLALIEV